MSPASERSFRIWLPLPEIWTRTLGGLWTSARPGGSWRVSVTSKLVVTGCCSCTATYSISARNSAAPLMGQLRVISWSRLARIEQPADQVLVDRRIPIGCADDFLDDHAVAIDDEALGHPGGLIDPADRSVAIVQDLERQPQILHELVHYGRVLFIDAHGDEPEIGAGELAMQVFHRRHLDLAGCALRRPEIELRPQLDGERDAEHRRHHDAGDQRPLLPVRHTLTMQRRRSSCTSRPGSALPNTALPATNVSAPACC